MLGNTNSLRREGNYSTLLVLEGVGDYSKRVNHSCGIGARELLHRLSFTTSYKSSPLKPSEHTFAAEIFASSSIT
jgi:hypothetical protein